MTKFIIHKATMADLDEMLEIEASAMKGGHYLYDDRYFFLEQQGNTGEMVLIRTDEGEAVGIGQFSIMPNGDGWLECLRVKEEWWRKGIGRTIYTRYFELADEFNVPHMAMYTGATNVASKALAEVFGFQLAATNQEFVFNIDPEGDYPMPEGFREVTDLSEAKQLIDEHHADWGPFMAFNRTWMHFSDGLYEYLINRHMIWTDGTNSIVLGCRMLEDRGWHIGWYNGDPKIVTDFAKAKTKEKGLPKININTPDLSVNLHEQLEANDFEKGGRFIVEEWTRK